MTSQTITGAYPGGFTLLGTYNRLVIENTASVGGTGVYVTAYAYVSSFGTVSATIAHDAGIYLNFGGKVTNNVGVISGYYGVKSSAGVPSLGTVHNYSTISGKRDGVILLKGGEVGNEGLITGNHDGVEGVGGATTVSNFGTITYSGYSPGGPRVGVNLTAGGAIFNNNGLNPKFKSLIQSDTGVILTSGTVSNFGTIRGIGTGSNYYGVQLTGAGTVTNGSIRYRVSLIEGYTGVDATSAASNVTNYGTIVGTSIYSQAGVHLSGGVLTNGGGVDTTALVEGFIGVRVEAAGTVTNVGTVDGNGISIGAYGALFTGGGRLTNGSLASHGAMIEGYVGVEVKAAAGSVTNYGTISGQGVTGQAAVILTNGGVVKNGGPADKAALVEGYNGVGFAAGGSLINYGTVSSSAGTGAQFTGGGVVVNGGGTDRSALIEGVVGIAFTGAAGMVKNFGTVTALGGAGDYGVSLANGGALANGSVNNSTALIEGYGGARLKGGAAGANFGTIWAQGDVAGAGVALGAGSSLTNGAAGHAGAVIAGFSGVVVDAGAASTVTNYGTIIGQGGTAVAFGSATGVLVVGAGSAFVGAVNGDGGMLELATGVGTLSNLASGDVTVSGSMAATTFSHFNTMEVGPGAQFTTAGAASIASGDHVIVMGSLTVASGLTNAGVLYAWSGGQVTVNGAVANTGDLRAEGGTMTVNGAVSGAGIGVVDTGALRFAATSTFNENVTFIGATGVLGLANSRTYAGTITGFGGTEQLDLGDIVFGGSTKASYSGSTSSGILTVTDGTHTAKIHLSGNYTASTFKVSSDGHGGTTVVDPRHAIGPPTISPAQPFIAAMAGFGARGGEAVATHDAWRTDASTLAMPRAMA